MSAFTVRRLETLSSREFGGLCDVLIDCVEGGASVSFMQPMTLAKAAEFWRDVAASMARGERALVVARGQQWRHHRHCAGRCGRAARISRTAPTSPRCWCIGGRGGSASVPRYCKAAEDAARDAGRSLLVLDTASDDAERLYERSGWQRVGTIPDYALMPDGALCATVVYYKRLV